MYHQRLDTEELIQETRDYYNASKYEQKIKEMEVNIQLKDKQILSLNSRISSLKQENVVKANLFEKQVADLKKQLGQCRANTVKERRIQNEKYQKMFANLKKQHHLKIQQLQEQHTAKYESIVAKHRQQIQRIQKKYEQLMQLQKKQLSAFKSSQQDKTSNVNLCVGHLEQEKAYLTKLKREAQQKCQFYRESMQKLKQEYKRDVFEKNEELNVKNGEIQGLKLQEKMLKEKLEMIKDKQFNSQSQSRQTYEELNQLCSKLYEQNEQLKRKNQEKNDQILSYFKQISQKQLQRLPINQIYECNHLSLISQMQKNLVFKEKEIADLKSIVQEWRSLIGFDKPLSQRLSEITQKSLNLKTLNSNFSQGLKKSAKNSKMTKN